MHTRGASRREAEALQKAIKISLLGADKIKKKVEEESSSRGRPRGRPPGRRSGPSQKASLLPASTIKKEPVQPQGNVVAPVNAPSARPFSIFQRSRLEVHLSPAGHIKKEPEKSADVFVDPRDRSRSSMEGHILPTAQIKKESGRSPQQPDAWPTCTASQAKKTRDIARLSQEVPLLAVSQVKKDPEKLPDDLVAPRTFPRLSRSRSSVEVQVSSVSPINKEPENPEDDFNEADGLSRSRSSLDVHLSTTDLENIGNGWDDFNDFSATEDVPARNIPLERSRTPTQDLFNQSDFAEVGQTNALKGPPPFKIPKKVNEHSAEFNAFSSTGNISRTTFPSRHSRTPVEARNADSEGIAETETTTPAKKTRSSQLRRSRKKVGEHASSDETWYPQEAAVRKTPVKRLRSRRIPPSLTREFESSDSEESERPRKKRAKGLTKRNMSDRINRTPTRHTHPSSEEEESHSEDQLNPRSVITKGYNRASEISPVRSPSPPPFDIRAEVKRVSEKMRREEELAKLNAAKISDRPIHRDSDGNGNRGGVRSRMTNDFMQAIPLVDTVKRAPRKFPDPKKVNSLRLIDRSSEFDRDFGSYHEEFHHEDNQPIGNAGSEGQEKQIPPLPPGNIRNEVDGSPQSEISNWGSYHSSLYRDNDQPADTAACSGEQEKQISSQPAGNVRSGVEGSPQSEISNWGSYHSSLYRDNDQPTGNVVCSGGNTNANTPTYPMIYAAPQIGVDGAWYQYGQQQYFQTVYPRIPVDSRYQQSVEKHPTTSRASAPIHHCSAVDGSAIANQQQWYSQSVSQHNRDYTRSYSPNRREGGEGRDNNYDRSRRSYHYERGEHRGEARSSGPRVTRTISSGPHTDNKRTPRVTFPNSRILKMINTTIGHKEGSRHEHFDYSQKRKGNAHTDRRHRDTKEEEDEQQWWSDHSFMPANISNRTMSPDSGSRVQPVVTLDDNNAVIVLE